MSNRMSETGCETTSKLADSVWAHVLGPRKFHPPKEIEHEPLA